MEKFRIQTPIIIGGLASLANKEKCMYYAYFVCLLIRLQVVTLEFTMQPVMCVLHQKTDLGTAGPAAARPVTMLHDFYHPDTAVQQCTATGVADYKVSLIPTINKQLSCKETTAPLPML